MRHWSLIRIECWPFPSPLKASRRLHGSWPKSRKTTASSSIASFRNATVSNALHCAGVGPPRKKASVLRHRKLWIMIPSIWYVPRNIQALKEGPGSFPGLFLVAYDNSALWSRPPCAKCSLKPNSTYRTRPDARSSQSACFFQAQAAVQASIMSSFMTPPFFRYSAKRPAYPAPCEQIMPALAPRRRARGRGPGTNI